MPLSTIASLFWAWIVDPGLTLGLWLIIALLIPRAGRLAMYLITNKIVAPDEDDTKTQLALAGVLVYLAQIAAYFLIFVFALSALGFFIERGADFGQVGVQLAAALLRLVGQLNQAQVLHLQLVRAVLRFGALALGGV